MRGNLKVKLQLTEMYYLQRVIQCSRLETISSEKVREKTYFESSILQSLEHKLLYMNVNQMDGGDCQVAWSGSWVKGEKEEGRRRYGWKSLVRWREGKFAEWDWKNRDRWRKMCEQWVEQRSVLKKCIGIWNLYDDEIQQNYKIKN